MGNASHGYELLNQAVSLVQEGLLDDPRVGESVERAIRSDDLSISDLASAHSLLGEHHKDRGDYDSALRELRKAVATSDDFPQFPYAHHTIGEILIGRDDDPAAAGPHFAAALEYDREYRFASDGMLLLATAIYEQAASQGDVDGIEQAKRLFSEAHAIVTSPAVEQYVIHFPLPKTLFQLLQGLAWCNADLPQKAHRFEAIEQFQEAERLARENLDDMISRRELAGLYPKWAETYRRLDLDAEAQRVMDRQIVLLREIGELP